MVKPRTTFRPIDPRRRRSPPRRGSPPATSSGPGCCSARAGASCATTPSAASPPRSPARWPRHPGRACSTAPRPRARTSKRRSARLLEEEAASPASSAPPATSPTSPNAPAAAAAPRSSTSASSSAPPGCATSPPSPPAPRTVVFNRDRLDQLRSQADGLGPAAARGGAELVQETRRGLDLNVSEELARSALLDSSASCLERSSSSACRYAQRVAGGSEVAHALAAATFSPPEFSLTSSRKRVERWLSQPVFAGTMRALAFSGIPLRAGSSGSPRPVSPEAWSCRPCPSARFALALDCRHDQSADNTFRNNVRRAQPVGRGCESFCTCPASWPRWFCSPCMRARRDHRELLRCARRGNPRGPSAGNSAPLTRLRCAPARGSRRRCCALPPPARALLQRLLLGEPGYLRGLAGHDHAEAERQPEQQQEEQREERDGRRGRPSPRRAAAAGRGMRRRQASRCRRRTRSRCSAPAACGGGSAPGSSP